MASVTPSETGAPLWSEEPASRPDRARIRARIGGLHCSLCTGTIEKALGRERGVDKVSVSLTHEQALVEYDPSVARPEALLQTLRDIGYTVSDPRKVRPFEEDEPGVRVHRGTSDKIAQSPARRCREAVIAQDILPCWQRTRCHFADCHRRKSSQKRRRHGVSAARCYRSFAVGFD